MSRTKVTKEVQQEANGKAAATVVPIMVAPTDISRPGSLEKTSGTSYLIETLFEAKANPRWMPNPS
jgi:hypothetical protein